MRLISIYDDVVCVCEIAILSIWELTSIYMVLYFVNEDLFEYGGMCIQHVYCSTYMPIQFMSCFAHLCISLRKAYTHGIGGCYEVRKIALRSESSL